MRDQARKTLIYIKKPGNRNRLGFAVDTTMGKILDNEAFPKFMKLDIATTAWEEREKRNQIIVNETTNAEKDFIPVYRKIYGFLKGNPDVTDTDLMQMELPARSPAGGRKSSIADESPAVEVDTSTNGQLKVYYYANGKNRNSARPRGQRGGEVRWGIFDTQPSGWDELPYSESCTNSPLVIKMKYEYMGKFFFCAVRWENTRGEKGPWSRIIRAVVV
jgi:hypothetical protein